MFKQVIKTNYKKQLIKQLKNKIVMYNIMYNNYSTIEEVAYSMLSLNSMLILLKLLLLLPFFYLIPKQRINRFIDFLTFISENNPLLLDYSPIEDHDDDDDDEDIKNKTENTNEKIDKETNIYSAYESKYLQKFKTFPNEFRFTEDELNNEILEFGKIKMDYTIKRSETLSNLEQKITDIIEIEENGGFDTSAGADKRTKNINQKGINFLLKYFNDDDDDNDENENCYDIDFEELYESLLAIKQKLLLEFNDASKLLTDDELRLQAREVIINRRLDKYIDNYILEYTPLGNVYMRYNNNKKSFEYFSNNTIPYRFLEPLGRKYVMTYWCKPIFIDIEEELINAEKKYDEEKEKEKEKQNAEEKQNVEDNKPPTIQKSVIATLKNYNKDVTANAFKYPSKNRANTNFVLPPQIKANLCDTTSKTDKHLLKNANRYTWEGRLSDFCPLKKRKINKINMTYAEFKKLHQQK